MNPPFGKTIGKWVDKAIFSSRCGCRVVFLGPARTDARWFHDLVAEARDIIFLRGRVSFVRDGVEGSPAPFPVFLAGLNVSLRGLRDLGAQAVVA